MVNGDVYSMFLWLVEGEMQCQCGQCYKQYWQGYGDVVVEIIFLIDGDVFLCQYMQLQQCGQVINWCDFGFQIVVDDVGINYGFFDCFCCCVVIN